jgi:hypothetical protein
MRSLHTFPRRLFSRRWQPKLSKLSQHFFFDSAQELSDNSTSYIHRWKMGKYILELCMLEAAELNYWTK